MTNPGGSTPWAGIPIPLTSKSPDVPVDLATCLDRVDTVMKNVIGGATAPPGALTPNVIAVSQQVAGINTQLSSLDNRLDAVEPTVTSQGSRLTTVESRTNFLYGQPVVEEISRPWQYTMWSSQTTDGEMEWREFLSPNYQSVMHVWLNATWKWQTSSVTWPIKTKVKIRVGGPTGTLYDRIRSVQSGWIQTHQGHYMARIAANTPVYVQLTCCTYSGGPANVNAQLYESRASAMAMFIPWNGATIPLVAIGTPPSP